MITNQIEVSAVLVTLEGLNANLKKPGVAMYIALNSQTKVWKMEQFVVRNGFKADKHRRPQGRQADVGAGSGQPQHRQGGAGQERPEGRRLHHRPARHEPARQRHDGRHLRRRLHARAQRLDDDQGRRRPLARGRRDLEIHPGDEKADAYAAGCAITCDFIAKRPDVAKRFAVAWSKAIDYINKNPDDARKYLAKNTFTPDNVVDMVSMLGYIMAEDMTPKQIDDLQKLSDFGTSIGVVPEKLDVTKVLLQVSEGAGPCRWLRRSNCPTMRGPRRRGPRRMSPSAA